MNYYGIKFEYESPKPVPRLRMAWLARQYQDCVIITDKMLEVMVKTKQ